MKMLTPMPALLALLLPGLIGRAVQADDLTTRMTRLAAQNTRTASLDPWKFHNPDVPGGESPGFDDTSWQDVQPGFTWPGDHTTVWFRTRFVVPPEVDGLPTEGVDLRFEVGVDDDGEIYVNGTLADRFHWDEGHVTLTDHARPGQVFTIAVRGINQAGNGGLRFARLVYDLLGPAQPDYRDYLAEAQFTEQIAGQLAPQVGPQAVQTLARSEAQINLAAVESRDWAVARAGLSAAHQTLLALAPITRQYDVFYVGHAHIDMNWLWPWEETIDVCHRTWDSALNLMGQFPDLGFVQSQPGAYAAIQSRYPAEFARMQAMERRGQWDVVGGLWDESDTNMPSGEAIARSLFLGQRYFKTFFGQYAVTGWLPDSFGHSWQLPQLFQEAGLRNFYHTRCGDGVRFSWWQSPDGTRVLKANTDSYDEPIAADQMARPWAIQQNYGLKQALVVFGVGDHGGGPTRDMILTGQELRSDPLFPKVHFVTADAFFRQLRAQPAVRSLPVVDTDLQYVFVGCYTTHADIKKAVRSSENNLYAAEVFSSLAAMQGQAYPVQGFEDAWKPTAFAQFHDIMCGSAIHSTYDWMHEQLAPAFKFEQAQTDRALQAITAHVDTRGAHAGERLVVVWNPLSFPRSDVVRLTVSGASRYRSVRDARGHAGSAQALNDRTLAFIAERVPAFGHATYFLSPSPAPAGGVAAKTSGNRIVLGNRFLRVTLAKDTGLITSLFDKRTGREMIAPGKSANVLEVLGDRGSAWDIDYTGEQHDLTAGADTRLMADGPVCCIVRVRHTFGRSTFTQDVTLYRDLPRLDVHTTVEWHEHGRLLKVAFPLAMQHPDARVDIPYGSIQRPTNGQENPGQKWMDVTEEFRTATGSSRPLDLSGLFNHRSARNFDGLGISYPADLMPGAGVHRWGAEHIPFRMASAAGPDNVACDGQTVPIPKGARYSTLYLLGAGAVGAQQGALVLSRADGGSVSVPFALGDWVMGGAARNEEALALDHRLLAGGAPDRNPADRPHLWMVSLPLPAGPPIVRIRLPRNRRLHLFAITLGPATRRTPLYGLTVLNDCKYGSDTNGSTFRLTLLRSSKNPDPNPDDGTQTFTYSLLPHAGDGRSAGAEQAGLALNVPLRAVPAGAHRGRPVPWIAVAPAGEIVAGALKHCEDGPGTILRLFETQGRDTTARLTFSQPVRVEETDLLERPVYKRRITVRGAAVTLPVGHDQIVTLRITGLPDVSSKPSVSASAAHAPA